VLEEGMVLALEPAKDYYHIQDMVVVRAGRPEWISDKFKTDQMFVIG
jgi:Xaa-Pro aminopeptidase